MSTNIDIKAWSIILTDSTPSSYYKRNHLQYELVSYLNSCIALYLAEQEEICSRFLCRSKDYLTTKSDVELDTRFEENVHSFLSELEAQLVSSGKLSATSLELIEKRKLT